MLVQCEVRQESLIHLGVSLAGIGRVEQGGGPAGSGACYGPE